MEAAIIAIGNELLTGAAVDTNSAWLSHRLAEFGVGIKRHITIGDDDTEIAGVIRQNASKVDLIFITGGLGPTQDDLTREALAIAAEAPLEENAEALTAVEQFFEAMNRPMSASNRKQAQVPRGAEMLVNPWGTAPGLQMKIGTSTVFALPGVPREMTAMFACHVEPFVAERVDAGLAVRVLHTFGQGESTVAEQLGSMMDPARNPAVGTTASNGIIRVRVVARAATREAAEQCADREVGEILKILGSIVYGEGADTLESVIGRMLIASGRTLSTGESCTGGMLAQQITSVPGSSAYFPGGYVTYANAQKQAILNVPADLIETHGAVSEQVAAAMALGARRRAGTDYALALTGVAGPDGGTAKKPVGLVYVALADGDRSIVRRLQFPPHLGRDAIRDRAARAALNLLRRHLLGDLESDG